VTFELSIRIVRCNNRYIYLKVLGLWRKMSTMKSQLHVQFTYRNSTDYAGKIVLLSLKRGRIEDVTLLVS
jgi:hypothetical protein